jgi:predicted metal-binding protein
MTYLIGGLHEEQTTSDLVPCVALYRQSRHGVAAFTMSPARLKAQFLAKWVP